MSNLFSGMTALETEGKNRPTTFDLRYKASTARFRFSASAQDALSLDVNGINVAINDGEKACLIGVVPKAKASLLTKATPEFSHPKLRAKLNNFIGRIEEGAKHQNFCLMYVGEHEGVRYFKIAPWNNESGLVDIETPVTTAPATASEETTDTEPAPVADVVEDVMEDAEETPAETEAEEDPEDIFAGLD